MSQMSSSPQLHASNKAKELSANKADDPNLEQVKRVLQGSSPNNLGGAKQFEEDQRASQLKNLPDAAAAVIVSPQKNRNATGGL